MWLGINIICFLFGVILGFTAYKKIYDFDICVLFFYSFIFIMCAVISEVLRLASIFNF